MMNEVNESRITVYFDTRRNLSNGTFPIKLRLYHNKKERPIRTGLSCLKDHWIYGDLNNTEYSRGIEKGIIRFVSSKHPTSKRLNASIQYKRELAENLLSTNSEEIKDKSIDEIKDLIVSKLKNPNDTVLRPSKKNSTLKEAFRQNLEMLEKGEDWGNYRIYKNSLDTFHDFLEESSKSDIKLIAIDKFFLYEFIQYCKSSKRGRIRKGQPREGMSPNSISIKLRCLRHLINLAIDDKNEAISYNEYPFRNFKLPKNATSKRAVGKDALESLRMLELKTGTNEWHHRNFFLFMFNNQGMNYIDLAFLKREQILGSRLEYSRTKTRGKASFSIELTEESMEILRMYDYESMSPNELVFPIIKDIYGEFPTKYVYDTYKNRTGDHNKYLKKLSKLALLDVNLTSYVARHTWASIGFEEFESIDVVGQGLGHGSDPKVTKVYAKDLKKQRMDEVNRSVTKRVSRIKSVD